MGTFSVLHWLIVLMVVFVFFGLQYLPAIWIFRKAGWSSWVWLAMCIPFAGIIVLWVFAFSQWPQEPARARKGAAANLSAGKS